MVIVIEKLTLAALQHAQNTVSFIKNEKFLDLCFILLEMIAIVLFLDPTLEVDSVLETIFSHIDFHQDHVQDLRMHLEDLLIIYHPMILKIKITTLKIFERQN